MSNYLLSEPTAAGLKRLLEQTPGLAVPPARGGRGRNTVLVRCTSATAAGGSGAAAQCYPAVVLDPASDDATEPEELGAIWLTVWGTAGAETPTVDQVYMATMSGDLEIDGDTRARAHAGQFGNGVSITDAYDTAIPGNTYSITADDTWEDVGLSVSLDAFGIYLVYAQVTAVANASALGPRIYFRMVDSSGAGLNGYFQTSQVVMAGAGVDAVGTASLFTPLYPQTAKTAKIQAKRTAGTWTTSNVVTTTTEGNSGLVASKIGTFSL